MCLLSSTIFAEETSLIANLLPQKNGAGNTSYRYQFPTDIKEVNGDRLSYQVVDVSTVYPVSLGKNSFLGIGADYTLHLFDLDQLTGYLNQKSFKAHQVSLPLSTYFFLGERWFLDFNSSNTLGTDFRKIDRDDIQFNGYSLAGVALSRNVSFFFGTGVSRYFWRLLPYPILGLVFRPEGGRFNFEMLLPSYARASLKMGTKTTLFIEGVYEGLTWDVEARGTVPKHFLNIIDTQAGGGLSYQLTRALVLEVFGGVNPYRKIEYSDTTGAKVQRTPNMDYFIQGGLVFRPE